MANLINVVSRRAVLVLLSIFCCHFAEFAWAQSAPQNSADELIDPSVFDAEVSPAGESQTSPQQQQQQIQRRGRGGRFGARLEGMYKSQVTPEWFANNTKFWDRNDLSGGAKEFIVVDAERGTRERAFDHEAVAKQIGDGAEAAKIPVEQLKFSADGENVTLLGRSKSWILNVKTRKLQESAGEKAEVTGEGLPAGSRPRPSTRTGPETEITFDNQLNREVEIFWLDEAGARQSYGKIEPRGRKAQHTFSGHV